MTSLLDPRPTHAYDPLIVSSDRLGIVRYAASQRGCQARAVRATVGLCSAHAAAVQPPPTITGPNRGSQVQGAIVFSRLIRQASRRATPPHGQAGYQSPEDAH